MGKKAGKPSGFPDLDLHEYNSINAFYHLLLVQLPELQQEPSSQHPPGMQAQLVVGETFAVTFDLRAPASQQGPLVQQSPSSQQDLSAQHPDPGLQQSDFFAAAVPDSQQDAEAEQHGAWSKQQPWVATSDP